MIIVVIIRNFLRVSQCFQVDEMCYLQCSKPLIPVRFDTKCAWMVVSRYAAFQLSTFSSWKQFQKKQIFQFSKQTHIYTHSPTHSVMILVVRMGLILSPVADQLKSGLGKLLLFTKGAHMPADLQ